MVVYTPDWRTAYGDMNLCFPDISPVGDYGRYTKGPAVVLLTHKIMEDPVHWKRRRPRRTRKLLPSWIAEASWNYAHPSKLLLNTLILFAATIALQGRASASSNPLELNGGSCLAMAGKDCVAVAVDRRFGQEGQLVSAEAKRVLKVNYPYNLLYT